MKNRYTLFVIMVSISVAVLIHFRSWFPFLIFLKGNAVSGNGSH